MEWVVASKRFRRHVVAAFALGLVACGSGTTDGGSAGAGASGAAGQSGGGSGATGGTAGTGGDGGVGGTAGASGMAGSAGEAGSGGTGGTAGTGGDGGVGGTAGASGMAGSAGEAGAGGAQPTPYEEAVELPDCDANDPTVFFIESPDDWDFINDPAYRVFCVKPGDYSSKGDIKLNVSGSAGSQRVIRHASDPVPGAVHPAHMADDDQAVISSLYFVGASHWLVDRLSIVHSLDGHYAVLFTDASTHNVLNRLRIEDFDYGVSIRDRCDENVLQNSLIGGMRMAQGQDGVCVALSSSGSKTHDVVTRGTRVVNNEIFHCNDGFQAVKHTDSAFTVDYPGTILANNEIYITPDLYSDCDGHPDTSGDCACAENAVDIKQGSSDPSAPMRIVDNKMWGWRRTDTKCGGSGSWGNALDTHFGVENLLIENNVIFDSARGIGLASETWNSEVRGNVVHSVHDLVPNTGHSLLFTEGVHDIIVEANTVVDTPYWIGPQGDRLTVTHNVLINAGSQFGGAGDELVGDFNRYFNTGPLSAEGANDETFATADESGYVDLCMDVRRWTTPQTICLDHAQPPDPG